MHPIIQRPLPLLTALTAALMIGCVSTSSETSSEDALARQRAAAAAEAKQGKTNVCHIPPGNPANAHTISVGNAAVDAHLAHGDSLGICTPTDSESMHHGSHKGMGKECDKSGDVIGHPGHPAHDGDAGQDGDGVDSIQVG